MTLRLITAPTSEPVTLEQAKLWLRLDGDAEIDTVEMLISAARQALDGADGYLGRCLVTQTWEMTLDAFPAGSEIRIPLSPVQSIVSVKYLDASGDEQSFSSDNYRFSADDLSGSLLLEEGASWPSAGNGSASVAIRFVVGYAGGVPEGLKVEILKLIGFWFENRQMAGQIPDGWSSRYRALAV